MNTFLKAAFFLCCCSIGCNTQVNTTQPSSEEKTVASVDKTTTISPNKPDNQETPPPPKIDWKVEGKLNRQVTNVSGKPGDDLKVGHPIQVNVSFKVKENDYPFRPAVLLKLVNQRNSIEDSGVGKAELQQDGHYTFSTELKSLKRPGIYNLEIWLHSKLIETTPIEVR